MRRARREEALEPHSMSTFEPTGLHNAETAIPSWKPWDPILVVAGATAVAGATPHQLREGSLPWKRFGTMLTWRTLLATGAHQLSPTLEEALRRLSERVTWKWTMTMVAQLLAEPVWRIEDQRRLTRAALLDDWPGAIFAANLVADAILVEESSRTAVAGAALRLLLVHLLKNRWVDPLGEQLDAERKLRLLCRVAMVVADFIPNTAPEIHVPAERPAYYNAELILPLLRESTREAPQAIIARADELYGELMPQNDSGWNGNGPEIVARAVSLCVLAEAVQQNVQGGGSTWFDPSHPPEFAERGQHESLIEVLDGVSLDQPGFASALAADTTPIPLAVLATYPVLRGDDGQYLILDRRLLFAAADEEILRSLELRHTDFKSRFGRYALEPLVQRMLERCFGPLEGAQIVRVPDEEARRQLGLPPMNNRKRCDFAVVLDGGDLVLVDSKLLMPPLRALGGVAGLRAFFDSGLPRALQQMIETTEDISTHGLEAVVPGLRARADLKVHAWIATYQPLGLWFEDGDIVVNRMGAGEQWSRHFCGPPYFVSLRDLEFLEANPASVAKFIEARRAGDPRATLDVESFLADVLGPGWPTCSMRAMARSSAAVGAQHGRGESPSK